MNQLIVVGISDYKLSKGPEVLVTYALGSCVGVCLYDKITKIGGMAHIMLPDSKCFLSKEMNRKKFADTGLGDLIRDLRRAGVRNNQIVAKIAGGAQMFKVQGGSKFGDIGKRNIESVKLVLRDMRIPILKEDIGLNFGRTQYFNLETGVMKIQSCGRQIREF